MTPQLRAAHRRHNRATAQLAALETAAANGDTAVTAASLAEAQAEVRIRALQLHTAEQADARRDQADTDRRQAARLRRRRSMAASDQAARRDGWARAIADGTAARDIQARRSSGIPLTFPAEYADMLIDAGLLDRDDLGATVPPSQLGPGA